MQSMNFDERTEAVKKWIQTEILPRFSPPNNLNIKMVLNDIASSVNRHLPSKVTHQEMPSLLSGVQENLVQIAMSRTLPPVRIFIEATKKLPKSEGEGAQGGDYSASGNTHLRMAIARVRGGKPVAGFYIEGSGRAQLLRNGISEEMLRPYDDYLKQAKAEVYGGAESKLEEVATRRRHEEVLEDAVNRMS